jgi:hypothetical protein
VGIFLEYFFEGSQNLLQRICAQLGRSTSAGCQAGKPDLTSALALRRFLHAVIISQIVGGILGMNCFFCYPE